ncbi:MAG: FtsX-like permease family protein [Steroidobacteraceae bacterium]|nr:ABC transporter permease [Gammaproteobacteria bacterium]
MRLALDIALSHLGGRRRQTLVSLLGVMLGVGFFLAVSALMRGSEADIIKRLVDSAPHITIRDEFRMVAAQPAELAYPSGAVAISSLKPRNEPRGIRQYRRHLASIDALADDVGGLQAAPILIGQAIFSFAGRNEAVTLSGVVPSRMMNVSAVEEDIIDGSLADLDADSNGIIIGLALAKKLSLERGENVTVVSPTGNIRAMKIVALFSTGNVSYDESQTFANLTRVQALLNRPNTANSIIVKLNDASQARDVAADVERTIGYKSVSWQEASKDLLDTLIVRNVIMYTVVGAILLVACFGIYNIISTVVLEKTRDIAILKSMGFHADDIRQIFVIEGAIIGVAGSLLGIAMGAAMTYALGQVEIQPPGSTEAINLPVYWGVDQFLLAASFAIGSAVMAAWLPARKGSRVEPVDILRGAV